MPTPPIDAFQLLEASGAPAPERLEAKARLRFSVAQALAQGRVSFHYQPVVRAANPRFPAFYESLARVRLPDGGLLAAGAIMPSIEGGALGRAIDQLALANAIEVLAANPGLRLSINMSPLSMGDAGWLAVLARAKAAGSGVCGRLIIEITEASALQHADMTIDFMEHARTTGCAFAIDDFGAGATGFKYFRDFRFDIVKIDGSYVRGVHRARDAQVLVECLGAVARHFEMMTVAEQVADPADAAGLARLGIDCLQGYLYGRPAAEPLLPEGETPGEVPAARRAAM